MKPKVAGADPVNHPKALSSNGRIPGFQPVDRGSSPLRVTNMMPMKLMWMSNGFVNRRQQVRILSSAPLETVGIVILLGS